MGMSPRHSPALTSLNVTSSGDVTRMAKPEVGRDLSPRKSWLRQDTVKRRRDSEARTPELVLSRYRYFVSESTENILSETQKQRNETMILAFGVT